MIMNPTTQTTPQRTNATRAMDTANLIRINLGCGPVQPQGWVNVDYSHRARLAAWAPWVDSALTRLHLLPPTEFSSRTTLIDLRGPLPFDDASIDAFYCGELLEHFTIEQTRALLRQCVRCLRPGGVLRACVPDNYTFWRRYCDEVERMKHAPREDWTPQGTEPRLRSFFRDICVDRPGLRSMGHFHKWAFDEISLVMEFEAAGLVGARRREPLDSDIPGVEDVEVRAQASFLRVEGRKPQ